MIRALIILLPIAASAVINLLIRWWPKKEKKNRETA